MSVDADISTSVDLLGKTVNQLQSGITVGADSVSGTLLYVDDYTGFSPSTPELQTGNYLALHFETPDIDNSTITVELVGGQFGPKDLDEDGICIFRVTDETTQKVKVTARADGFVSVTKTYKLTGLTLNES